MLTENCFQLIKVVKRLYVYTILSTRDDGTVTLQTKVLLKLSATSKVLQVQKHSAAHPTQLQSLHLSTLKDPSYYKPWRLCDYGILNINYYY